MDQIDISAAPPDLTPAIDDQGVIDVDPAPLIAYNQARRALAPHPPRTTP